MHNPSGSEVLSILAQAVAPVWNLIDDFTTLFAEYEDSQDDVASRLKTMRRSHTSSLQLLHGLQELQRTMWERIEQFTQSIGRFDSCMSRTALNYGLNLLPDDVLSEIFVIAAATLEEKVTLSLVCKRFRSVMMSMRKMWDGYWLESSQSPVQIVAIAEGSGFGSLKARINRHIHLPPYIETWIARRGLDLKEYSLRYHKFSVRLILSFGPEQLEFDRWHHRDWREFEPILGSANVQNLRGLAMGISSRNPTTIRLLERWHMPHLQNLQITFVPRAALARNLVQFSSYGIGIRVAEFDSLMEFLAAAKSLQDLKFYLQDATPRFYDLRDLPSLRSLTVNFLPHLSLARCLIRFRLSLRYRIRPDELLDFLSSLEALEELAITGGYAELSEGAGAIDALPAVTMPSVVLLGTSYYNIGPALIPKLRMPALRTLKLSLRGFDKVSAIIRYEFRFSLQSMTSLEELELQLGVVGIDDLDEFIRYAPPYLESLSLRECNCSVKDRRDWDASPARARNWKLIHCQECMGAPDFVATFIDYLGAIGLGGVKLQFSACKEWRDGMFGLDDVMSAEVDHDQEKSDVTAESDDL